MDAEYNLKTDLQMNLLTKPLLVLLPALSLAKVDGYSLKYVPKEGATLRYMLSITMDLQGVQAKMDSNVEQKVLKVDPDGTYSVQSNTLSGKAVFGGQELQMPTSVSVTVYRANGEVVSISGAQVDPTSMRTQFLTMLKRPDNPVKASDTWIEDIKSDPVTKTPSVHGSFKFDGEEKVGSVDALKIEATVSEGDVATPGSTLESFWIDKADGSIVKYDCKFTNMPFPGAPGPISGTMAMVRAEG